MHSKRLKPLHKVAQKKEDTAVRRYVERQQVLQQHEQKLAELEGYLAEYSRPTSASQDMVQLRLRREFIERLRSIVKLEAGVVEQARLACNSERAQWLVAHRSTEVLDRLALRYRQQEQRVEIKREQRDSDEIAVQIWRALQEGL